MRSLNFLASLTVGDKVLVKHHVAGMGTHSRVAQVTRTTASTLWCGASRFWRKNGDEVGSASAYPFPRGAWLDEWTQAAEDKIKAAHARAELRMAVRHIDGSKLSTDKLQRIMDIVNEK